LGRHLSALLDTGSEISIINAETARRASDLRIPPLEGAGEIHLADGTRATIPGRVSLPVTIHGRTVQHTFSILPTLDSPALIGMDLWARFRLAIPPPPLRDPTTEERKHALAGVTPHDQSETVRLQEFLKAELAAFKSIEGPTDQIEHVIRVKTDRPIKQRYRPRNPAMQRIIDDEVEEMLRNRIIEPSTSPWSSPVVIVKKRDGRPRFCIDFRKVNEVSEPDAYPLPQIHATLDKLRGARYLTTLDLQQGYWQVPLAPESRAVTAFTVPGRGLMQFRVMPFGLHSAPATFQRLLDTILGPELEPNVFVYLDDVIVVSATFDEHLKHLAEVFRRLRNARLRLNPNKCHFCRAELKYLGHIVDHRGIRTDPEKVQAMTQWPRPTNVRQIRQFVGLASWYRRFIPEFSTTAAPLTRLTRKNAHWRWGEDEERAFTTLKKSLASSPILACPDFKRRFVLQTDASSTGLGAVLTQHFEEGERVIAYASRTLNGAEKNYSATELECLAVVWGIRHFRGYLEGYEFTVVTDHQALRWLQKLESPTGRLGRWMLELQQYNFNVKYRRGRLNRVADALSRLPAVRAIRRPRCPWYYSQLQRVRAQPDAHPEYTVRRGKLFRHILHTTDFRETPARAQWKECVPKPERVTVLNRIHDHPTAGHLGIAKTIARAAERYYWPRMFADIARYVRRCANCLAHKASQERPAGLLHATPVKAPWEQVSIDLVGPLPRSTDGHSWLLVMQDRFTKWVELSPLRRATTPAVIKQLAERIIYRHGCPDTIISDNGRQFAAAAMSTFLSSFGVHTRKTPTYAPHCNPVERTNKTIKTMVAQYVGRNHRHWDRHIPALQFAYNTARHDVTGYTPAFLNHGRELHGPHPEDRRRNIAHGTPDANQRHLQDAQEVVRANLARAFQRQAHHYDLRRRDWRPNIGDEVWRRSHQLSSKKDAVNAKLAPKYHGPYNVRRIISPVIVDLRNAQGKWQRHVHIQDLKPTPRDESHNKPTDDENNDDEDNNIE